MTSRPIAALTHSKVFRALIGTPIKKFLSLVGFEIRSSKNLSIKPKDSDYFSSFLKGRVDCILYVGANHGQYFDQLRADFPEAPIYLYEPDPELVSKLKIKLEHAQTYFIRNCAVGSKFERKPFYLTSMESNLRLSSSLLKMAPKHEQWSKDSIQTNAIEVDVIPLDSESFEKYNSIYLKIDIQGYELEAFTGAEELLNNKIIAIDTEVSFHELYFEEANWLRLCTYLEEKNFNVFGIDPWGVYYKNYGELLQADLQFVKANLLA
jgi:FkbM family methyltransferase